jgi:spermidine/putrescine transport system substrate-binding protein
VLMREKFVVALAGLALSLGLAACGSDLGGGGNEGEVEVAEADGEATGDLYVANWPFYIDRNTVDEFSEATGINVTYRDEVDDNNVIFTKLQPLLDKGESGGRDIVVVTDWMAKKMYDLGYLQDFDQDAVAPAKENLVPSLASPAFDPDRSYSLPWQSGMTGLVVNKAEAPDVDEIADIFDPQYKGRVTVLTELRDTVPLVMKSMGVDPADATADDWLAAIDKLQEAVDSGQLRDFTGNSYTNAVARGDAAVAIGWSGDAIQLQADNPDIDFVMPKEGCILWSDNMVIPVGAPNPAAAYEWMNYVYEPKNQAQIADYNYYFTPVTGVKELLEKQGSPAAKSPLVFPTDDFTQNCSVQPDPPEDSVEEIEREFQSLITGGG